jgi:hypothetical protein
MATDYDAPRRLTETEGEADESIQAAQAAAADRRAATRTLETDENDMDDSVDLPGADLSGEELTVRVVPKQHDEFTCTSCFLVHHRSQRSRADSDVCRDCA